MGNQTERDERENYRYDTSNCLDRRALKKIPYSIDDSDADFPHRIPQGVDIRIPSLEYPIYIILQLPKKTVTVAFHFHLIGRGRSNRVLIELEKCQESRRHCRRSEERSSVNSGAIESRLLRQGGRAAGAIEIHSVDDRFLLKHDEFPPRFYGNAVVKAHLSRIAESTSAA